MHHVYQKISQHVSRNTLVTPRNTSNMLEPHSYTGVRITEGVYDRGEKSQDLTKWLPHKSEPDVKSLECRAMEEHWRGDYYLQLTVGSNSNH